MDKQSNKSTNKLTKKHHPKTTTNSHASFEPSQRKTSVEKKKSTWETKETKN